jgi:EpsI family protein
VKKTILATLSVVLLAAVAMVAGAILGSPKVAARKEPGWLAREIPRQLDGWQGRDQPLGETEVVLKRTIDTLNFDDAVYRIYQRGSDEVGVYIAYWGRGKTAVREVESHVPDICWRFAGWDLTEKRPDSHLSASPKAQLPCEYRVFTMSGQTSHVAYWHVLEGRVVENYGIDRIVPWWAPVRDVLRFGLKINGEQYFVRIHSNRDLDQLKTDPVIQRLIATVIGVSGGTVPALESSPPANVP